MALAAARHARAVAEFAQDVPGFELGIGSLAGSGEPRRVPVSAATGVRTAQIASSTAASVSGTCPVPADSSVTARRRRLHRAQRCFSNILSSVLQSAHTGHDRNGVHLRLIADWSHRRPGDGQYSRQLAGATHQGDRPAPRLRRNRDLRRRSVCPGGWLRRRRDRRVRAGQGRPWRTRCCCRSPDRGGADRRAQPRNPSARGLKCESSVLRSWGVLCGQNIAPLARMVCPETHPASSLTSHPTTGAMSPGRPSRLRGL